MEATPFILITTAIFMARFLVINNTLIMENSVETTSCEAKRTPVKINWGKTLIEKSRHMFEEENATENVQLKIYIEKPIIIKNPPQFLVDLIQDEIKRKKKREEEILSRKPDFEINLKDH